MYIRIQDNNIYFRVSKKEAHTLIDGTEIIDSFIVLNQQRLDYSISIADHESFDFESSNHLKLKVKLKNLRAELSTRPTKKGIMIDPSLTHGVNVFLQIDIKNTIKKTLQS